MYRRCQNSFGCCPVGKHVVLHSMKVRKGGGGGGGGEGGGRAGLIGVRMRGNHCQLYM